MEKNELYHPPRLWNVAIIGGGWACLEFLEMLANDYRYQLKMNVVGVASEGYKGVGIDFAYRWGIETIVSDYRELYKHPEIDLLIELTGNQEISNEISRTKPPHMHFIDHVGAHFFWELFKLADEKNRIEKETARELLLSRFKLQETQEFLQNILRNSPNIIFTTDTGGKILSINNLVETTLGRSRKDLTGKPLASLAQDAELFSEFIQQAFQKGSAQVDEILFLQSDGTPLYFTVSLTAISDPEHKPTGLFGICRDITKRKRLQEELEHSERLAVIGRIVAGITHEINNPLAIINETALWMDELLEDIQCPSPEDQKEFKESIFRIIEQNKRCQAITRGLLGFARKSETTAVSVNLHKILEDTLFLLNYEIKYLPIRFEKHFAPDLPEILSDHQLLEQVFVNLLTNAIYAIKEKHSNKGTITLTTELKDTTVSIHIEDTGIGIPEEKIGRIFELFYTSKPTGKGTGLGLALCNDIVKKLGGTISVKSQEGKGTIFSVHLPLNGQKA